MLRGYSQAVLHKRRVSGPPDKQLRDGWPDAAIINPSRAGLLHAVSPCDAAGQSSPHSLLLPIVSQRLQEQAGHGETLAHTHRREALHMFILSTQISHQRKLKGPHATHAHGHHHALLGVAGTVCAARSGLRKGKRRPPTGSRLNLIPTVVLQGWQQFYMNPKDAFRNWKSSDVWRKTMRCHIIITTTGMKPYIFFGGERQGKEA